MKRITAMLLAVLMLLSLVACGDRNSSDTTENDEISSHQGTLFKKRHDDSDTTDQLDEIYDDFVNVTKELSRKKVETFKAVGNTYEDYKKNKGLVNDWIATILSESDALFTRTREASRAYFELIAADPNHEKRIFCSKALDEYREKVCTKAMDRYLDTLHDDAMDDLYNQYYDGIFDDVYDKVEDSEWNDASSECYAMWADARAAIFHKWSYEKSYLNGLWSAMDSAFCKNDTYDVGAILEEYDQKKALEDAKKAAEEAKVYTQFDVIYEVNSDGDAEIVGFTGEGNQVIIYSDYDGHDVVRIADSAFKDCTMLESIRIWADVKEIGNSAFKGCTGLTEITIPNVTTLIGHNAFEGCSNLETLINLGNPDFGEYAFANCVNLTEIIIDCDTKNIGAHAFEGCTGITSLIMFGVEIIGDFAFSGCTGIKEVTIPFDVLSIGNHAFEGCTAMSYIYIGNDDTAIGEDAFANCPNLSDVPSTRGTVLECTLDPISSSVREEVIEPTQSVDLSDSIRPEFKEAMDAYEAYFVEFIKIMEKLYENPTDESLQSELSELQKKSDKIHEAYDVWKIEELNEEELAYYIAVKNRVMNSLTNYAD